MPLDTGSVDGVASSSGSYGMSFAFAFAFPFGRFSYIALLRFHSALYRFFCGLDIFFLSAYGLSGTNMGFCNLFTYAPCVFIGFLSLLSIIFSHISNRSSIRSFDTFLSSAPILSISFLFSGSISLILILIFSGAKPKSSSTAVVFFGLPRLPFTGLGYNAL